MGFKNLLTLKFSKKYHITVYCYLKICDYSKFYIYFILIFYDYNKCTITKKNNILNINLCLYFVHCLPSDLIIKRALKRFIHFTLLLGI